MKILVLDAAAGISGDMTLGAFIDLGIDSEYLKDELAKLSVPGFHLEIEKTTRQGICGTKCRVVADRHEHAHRHLKEITEMIENSALSPTVKETALAIFNRVARAEARVHGVTVDQVHFHEVGAVDSIVDITGSAICYHALKVDRVVCTGLNVGSGVVKCAHGLLPVPAPATVEILSETALPVFSRLADGEATTPTGAAIAAELAEYVPSLPQMRILKSGWGFGDKTFEIVNGLRMILGETGDAPEKEDLLQVWVVETNIDDMTGEMAGYVLEALLSQGVRDAFYTPVYMKKNRPGIKLSVICDQQQLPEVEACLLKETTSIGLRKIPVDRVVMNRQIKTVDTPLGPVRIKVSTRGELSKAMPEYEDLKALAQKTGRSLLEIQQMVFKILAELEK